MKYGHCYRCGTPYVRTEDPFGQTLLMPTCECAGDPPIDHTSDEWLVHLGRVHVLHYQPDLG